MNRMKYFYESKYIKAMQVGKMQKINDFSAGYSSENM